MNEEKARAALIEARSVVAAIVGENQPAREWALRVREQIDAVLCEGVPTGSSEPSKPVLP